MKKFYNRNQFELESFEFTCMMQYEIVWHTDSPISYAEATEIANTWLTLGNPLDAPNWLPTGGSGKINNRFIHREPVYKAT